MAEKKQKPQDKQSDTYIAFLPIGVGAGVAIGVRGCAGAMGRSGGAAGCGVAGRYLLYSPSCLKS